MLGFNCIKLFKEFEKIKSFTTEYFLWIVIIAEAKTIETKQLMLLWNISEMGKFKIQFSNRLLHDFAFLNKEYIPI